MIGEMSEFEVACFSSSVRENLDSFTLVSLLIFYFIFIFCILTSIRKK